MMRCTPPRVAGCLGQPASSVAAGSATGPCAMVGVMHEVRAASLNMNDQMHFK